jgi:hypothetical protein
MKFQLTSFFIILLVHCIQIQIVCSWEVKDRLASKVDSHPNIIYVITRQIAIIRKLGVLVYKTYLWKKINYFRNNTNWLHLVTLYSTIITFAFTLLWIIIELIHFRFDISIWTKFCTCQISGYTEQNITLERSNGYEISRRTWYRMPIH